MLYHKPDTNRQSNPETREKHRRVFPSSMGKGLLVGLDLTANWDTHAYV